MPSDGSVSDWLNRLACQDASAERELFDRYFFKLVEFARQRGWSAPGGIEDEEDLALIAMNSFFRRASQGQFPELSQHHELWSLLVTIVIRKAINRHKKDSAVKRGGGRAQWRLPSVDDDEPYWPQIEAVANSPGPELLAELNDQLQRAFSVLNSDVLKKVASLRLEGFTNQEIAAHLAVAERTVRRKLDLIRREWAELPD